MSSGVFSPMQPQGDVGCGFDVLGIVFARRAVAARCRLRQYAVAVEQADVDSVEFGLAYAFCGLPPSLTVVHALCLMRIAFR